MSNQWGGGGPTLSSLYAGTQKPWPMAGYGQGLEMNPYNPAQAKPAMVGGGGDQAGYDAAMARYNEALRASGGAAMIAPPDRSRFGLGPSYGPNGPVSRLGSVDPGFGEWPGMGSGNTANGPGMAGGGKGGGKGGGGRMPSAAAFSGGGGVPPMAPGGDPALYAQQLNDPRMISLWNANPNAKPGEPGFIGRI